jgi:hypothetical protein
MRLKNLSSMKSISSVALPQPPFTERGFLRSQLNFNTNGIHMINTDKKTYNAIIQSLRKSVPTEFLKQVGGG